MAYLRRYSMVVTGIYIVIVLLVLGYLKARNSNIQVLDSTLFKHPPDHNKLVYGIDVGYSDSIDTKIHIVHGSVLTPKQYGERFGTGASRNKRTNRLKFRK